MSNYTLIRTLSSPPINGIVGQHYFFEREECHLFYIVYDYQTELDTIEATQNRDLLGRGFLEGRERNLLDWTNYSRLDIFYIKYDDFLNKQNVLRRLVFSYNKTVVDLETSCNEDLIKVAEEVFLLTDN